MLWMVGSILILTTVALWVGEAASFISSSTDDHWWHFTLQGGLLALGGALLLRVLQPVTKQIVTSRCTVCGRPTGRGHTYCLDHLQETVNAGRDEARSRTMPRPKTL
jgi:predicted nucleic acid-binding Zn ribbon protein